MAKTADKKEAARKLADAREQLRAALAEYHAAEGTPRFKEAARRVSAILCQKL
jgi:hypothetical protein